jgi:hypothetical protein
MTRRKLALTDRKRRASRKPRAAREASRAVALELDAAYVEAQAPLRVRRTHVAAVQRVTREVCFTRAGAPAETVLLSFRDCVRTLRARPTAPPVKKTPGKLEGAPLVCDTSVVRGERRGHALSHAHARRASVPICQRVFC